MNDKKIKLGQFFTKAPMWLKPQIREFIKASRCTTAYDPFAGDGDLLKAAVDDLGFHSIKGLDVDPSLDWEMNDSLYAIPTVKDAIIITNPPYLSNYSASRKKVFAAVAKYFEHSSYDDLYLIALEKMLESQEYVVAIIPETFINARFLGKNRLSSITVLEDNLFLDTDTPICVACFDGIIKNWDQISVYKNDEYAFNLQTLEDMRLIPKNNIPIRFNVLSSWLGLRAVDTTNPQEMIRFGTKDTFDYDWEKGIKVSSRLLSVIEIEVPEKDRSAFIKECNRLLYALRLRSKDLILSPFKGNMKNGVRRRRLDFYTARAILEQAYEKLYTKEKPHAEQLRLF